MSSALSGLTRFNVAPSRAAVKAFADLSEPIAPVQEIAPAVDQTRTEPPMLNEPAIEAAHPLDEALASTLDQLVKTLNVAKATVDVEMSRAVAQIATSLLPTLAEAGLAEEIVRQLPNIVSVKARVVTLKCAPQIASKLSTLIEQIPSFRERGTITADSAIKPGHVDISWGEGGVTYDLEASLADLIGTPAPLKI